VKEFQEIQLAEAWNKYGGTAQSEIKWLKGVCTGTHATHMEHIEIRTLAAVFDLCVQQGGFNDKPPIAKKAIEDNLRTKTYSSQKEILEMAVLERARTASADWRNTCGSRRLGFLNAAATPCSAFEGKSVTISNSNYSLLTDNPIVEGL